MKEWKYITGSEKDFEGAPDWATIYCEGKDCNVFYENSDFSGKWQNKGSQLIGVDGRGNFPIIAQRELIEVWDGEGLPSVGIVCQWNNGNEWTTVNVLGVNGNELWVKPEDGSESFVVNDDDFKPLPDERETVVKEMLGSVTNYNMTAVIHTCRELYDAGYRKHSAAPGFEYRLACQCCGSKVEPGQELYHGCDS